MRLLILISCLTLASCGALFEEVAAEPVSQAVESTVVASYAMEEATTSPETATVATADKITFWRDPQYECEYIITPKGGITTRIVVRELGRESSHVYHEVSE